MRNPNRKHKSKHMTKIKYRRVELDWILVYHKSSKKACVKSETNLYVKYRYGMAYYLEK